MKLKIEKLDTKQVQTARGEATKVGVFSGGKWYSCFGGQWNSNWQVGMEIDVEIEHKPGKEPGQVYLNIKAPQKSYGGGMSSGADMVLAEMNKKLDSILAILKENREAGQVDDQIPF